MSAPSGLTVLAHLSTRLLRRELLGVETSTVSPLDTYSGPSLAFLLRMQIGVIYSQTFGSGSLQQALISRQKHQWRQIS